MKRFSVTTLAALILVFSLIISSSALSAEIVVNRIANVASGERHSVTIEAIDVASEISSFDILLAHDQSLGMVLNIRSGDLHRDYGWEYFTYRQYSRDTVEANWPGFKTSLINIIGMASPVDNTPTPVDTNNVILAKFDVILPIVTGSFSDEVWTPFSFFWRDCNDNILTSYNHDTVYTASGLFENEWSQSERVPISNPFPGFGLPDHPCSSPSGEEVVEKVEFVNSGILFFVIDPVEQCLNGDLNCNGIHYELSDAQVYTNIIIYGLGACVCELTECVKQTDVNCDGTVLTVADLVYLIRVIIGEKRTPFTKPQFTSNNFASLSFDSSNDVTLITDREVAGVFIKAITKSKKVLGISEFELVDPNVSIGHNGDTVNILFVDFTDNEVFDAGVNPLFTYSGEEEIELSGSAVDIYGNEIVLKLESEILPDSPKILQNYPNPFNPSTTIEFSLPTYSDWSIEIYNVTGQLVNRFDGASVGRQEVIWDGKNLNRISVSSGVYFYKLVTNDETSSRKMLLLK